MTAEKWEGMMGEGGDGSTPTRVAGVFLLDRYAEGFEETLKASGFFCFVLFCFYPLRFVFPEALGLAWKAFFAVVLFSHVT